MLFGLLEVALACFKWALFLVIIAGTFLLGLALLAMALLVLVGAVMGLAVKEGDAEVCSGFRMNEGFSLIGWG